jgi:pyruvate kinase
MRKTKIICTIGPSTQGVENIIKLIDNGMDAARLNFSHGNHEYHLKNIADIRKASETTEKPIAILLDLQGPKIRIGKFENGSANLENAQEFIISSSLTSLGNKNQVSTTYTRLPQELSQGNTLLLDDGYIILEVKNIIDNNIITKVIKGGILKDNKGIVAPGVSFSAPSMSKKDLDDLKFGLESGIDAIALSFVRSERDIFELKTAMKIFGNSVPIISKIERPEAIANIDSIINESDGIMVARGDLGLELPPEKVPVIQKEIIKKCNYHGKPVIIATQMLESMINNPRPTRAEASDVANAVLDGCDCVMLSAETSVGQFPFDSVNFMTKIIAEIEQKFNQKSDSLEIPADIKQNISDAMAKASVVIAEQIKASAIVAYTSSGFTAKNIAKYRPVTPIIVLTDSPNIQRRMQSFIWGVKAICIQPENNHENIFEKFSEILKNISSIKNGDFVVFIAGLTAKKIMQDNIIKVYQV